MSEPRKIIAIIGATGAQGSGIVDALLNSGTRRLHIRTLTRDRNAAKAQTLAERGVEVIQGDFEDDTALRKLLVGADAMFLNLDFWTLGFDKEVALGLKIVDEAVKLGVKYIVYSSLEACGRNTAGRLACPWFDSKTYVEDHVRRSGVPFTIVKMATYMENLMNGHTRITQDPALGGAWKFWYPLHGRGLTLVPVHDVGRVIAVILLDNSGKYHEPESIGLAGDHLTGEQMAKIFEETRGEKAVFVDNTGELPPASANMWRYKYEFEDQFKDYVRQTREIVPNVLDFASWLRKEWVSRKGCETGQSTPAST